MATAVARAKANGRAKNDGAEDQPAGEGSIIGIVIPRPRKEEAVLTIKGLSPLIMHAWSAKAQQMIEDKVTGKAKAQREARKPEEEWREASYIVPGFEWKGDESDWEPGHFTFPAPAFKHAFLYGVSQLDDVKNVPKTKATGWVFFPEDPILQFESVTLRTDIGRNPTQPVYRPQFNDWSVELRTRYNANAISLEQVVALLDSGLSSGGIGEWRPTSPKNKSGSYGLAEVVEAQTRK